MAIDVGDDAELSSYAVDAATATFHICGRCGVVVVATTEIAGRLFGVVNVNVLEGIDDSRLRRSNTELEGEELGARLARRRKRWIPDVAIDRR